MKNLLCSIFGHKPKQSPPIMYWRDGHAVLSEHIHKYCGRCYCSEIDMMSWSEKLILLKKWEAEDKKKHE